MNCENCKFYSRINRAIGLCIICRYDVQGTSEACRRFSAAASTNNNQPLRKVIKFTRKLCKAAFAATGGGGNPSK